tara:strand:- start:1676 stop:2089 length:414 start_codon:yes stop_codon:yes gene_type:complete
MSLPIISICGNLKKIESKLLTSGKQLVSFQVECSEKNAKGEWENLYIKGEVWEKSAKFVEQYFKEGSAAIVTGKLVTNVYEKQDGTKVYENKFLFPNVTFAPKDKEVQQQAQQPYNAPQQQQNSTSSIDTDLDNIPF